MSLQLSEYLSPSLLSASSATIGNIRRCRFGRSPRRQSGAIGGGTRISMLHVRYEVRDGKARNAGKYICRETHLHVLSNEGKTQCLTIPKESFC